MPMEERRSVFAKMQDEAVEMYEGKRKSFSHTSEIEESSMMQGDIRAYIYNANFNNDFLAIENEEF